MTEPALTREDWNRILPSETIGYAGDYFGDKLLHVARTEGLSAKRKIAALALLGEPFGFTWEDVDLLREEYQNEYSGTSLGGELLNLADRIAALLPPRDDEADR